MRVVYIFYGECRSGRDEERIRGRERARRKKIWEEGEREKIKRFQRMRKDMGKD